MIPAPYLKPIKKEGGTLYVFPSVSRDLTRTVVSGDYEFVFSHYACLNLPDILPGEYDMTKEGSDEEMEKGLYLETILRKQNQNGDMPSGYGNDYNQLLTENLQNYVMNFEAAILNGEGDDDAYDNDVLTNVSEKIFFNWLQKIGGIKFEDNGVVEKCSSLADRTVQYIGDLDVMNTVEVNGDSFEELYIHVPSTAGASTNVYFRTGEMTDNKNYLNKRYVVSGADAENNLIGRSSNTYPFTDLDPDVYASTSINTTPWFDKDEGGNFYDGDMGHTIDFRDSVYDGGYGINNMNAKSLENFEFNAVLIYYDIYERTDKNNVKKIATNLYGVLFLEEIGEDTGRYFIQRYPKIKETLYGNGNSYALKLDLKIDTIGDSNCDYGKVEDPNSATSMTMYMKSLDQLQRCIDFFYAQKNEIVRLAERVSTLENMVLGIDTVSSLKEDINRLYDLCDGNSIVDTPAILGLIDANTKRLETILNGGKDLKLQFDTDVLQPGTGIGMKKELNKVTISSEQKYSINTVTDIAGNDVSANNMISTRASAKVCNIPLKPGENFAVIYMRDEGQSETNVNINIDDTECNWEVGQSLKIFFVYEEGGSLTFMDSLENGIIIKPNVNTNTTTLSIKGYDFEGNNLIEVVCVAEGKFIYLIK